MSGHSKEFLARRNAVRERLDDLPGNYANDSKGRHVFFDAVYEGANGDEAQIPWADLAAKQRLTDWLENNQGKGRSAIDVGCGLGDNAEALALAGYQTSAFDVAQGAVDWARRRFPETSVTYRAADLFDLPKEWSQAFDLVHECYTLQALPEGMIKDSAKAICNLVAPGGKLLVYTRMRADGAEAKGPPWPVEEHNLSLPGEFGLTLLEDSRFDIEHADGRLIPHSFAIWRR